MLSQLTLTVRNASTKIPIPDVVISLKSIVSGQVVATQKTDSSGTAVFSVDEGVWKYTAFKGSYQGKEDSVYLSYPAAKYLIELIPESTTEPPPEAPSGSGYWQNQAASPNDSSKFAYGVQYGSLKQCVDAWTSRGYSVSSHRCTYVPSQAEKDLEKFVSEAPARMSALEKGLAALEQTVLDAISGFEEKIQELLDLEVRIKMWIEEQIIAILLRALDRESEKVK